MWTLVKLSAPAFPVSEIVFFRSIFAMATLAVWLASRGEWPGALKTTRPLGHIGRSIAGSCGMFGSFLALALLPLAVATAFTFATPLMIVPLAAIVLGEEVPLARGLTVALGFVGVLVMLSGQFGEGSASRVGAFVALFAAGSGAVAMIQTRRLVQSEATGAIVFYFFSVTALVSLAILVVALFMAGRRSVRADGGEPARRHAGAACLRRTGRARPPRRLRTDHDDALLPLRRRVRHRGIRTMSRWSGRRRWDIWPSPRRSLRASLSARGGHHAGGRDACGGSIKGGGGSMSARRRAKLEIAGRFRSIFRTKASTMRPSTGAKRWALKARTRRRFSKRGALSLSNQLGLAVQRPAQELRPLARRGFRCNPASPSRSSRRSSATRPIRR